MSSKLSKTITKNRAALALGMSSFGVTGALGVQAVNLAVSADTQVTAGSFDLTKQATEATFPVMFDRPSGVNAAALATTVINLGSDSDLYASAAAAVPEIKNSSKMASLLSDALSTDSATKSEARGTIVKLINWYNSLGGEKITTQSGAAYTVDNLEEPINVLAVAFSNDGTINSRVSGTITNEFAGVKTVSDVMGIFDGYKAGTSTAYKSAFDAYAAKVYAPGADISALSTYDSVKDVLNAYEAMYASGAAAIRAQLLENSATATEAGVTFFESAVITGRVASSDNGGSSSNTPEIKDVTTRWVDESGNELAPNETGKDYKGQKTFDGYTFKEVRTNDGTRTYVYTKVKEPTPAPKTEDTNWVDESGNKLKPQESGTKPDNDGKSDIDGYTLVSTKTETDTDGNVHTVNVYKKTPTPEPEKTVDTYWFDDEGNQLKDRAVGQTLPDNDGKTDIPGYKVLTVYTVTEEDLATGGKFAGSGFKVGDTINIYEKDVTPKTPITRWVDESGNPLQDPKDGQFPDNDGKSDIPDYTLVSTTTDENGNVTNVYKKTPTPEPKTPVTKWVDKDGNQLKPQEDGSKPDKEGDDIPGYRIISTTTDEDGNVVNTYEKIPESKQPITKWVDKNGNPLKTPEEGTKPDTEGDDIPGYTLVSTETDPEGNVVNTYEKTPVTKWVDKDGNPLKPQEDGSKPDQEGDDIPGYTLVSTETDEDGNVVNTYEKTPEAKTPVTKWVDKDGNPLKDPEDGSKPDTEGDDIPGYKLVSTDTDEDGNVINVYEKILTTEWVDQDGNPLKDKTDGSYPDNDGTSDIDGYVLDRIDVDEDGNIVNVYKKAEAPVEPEVPAKPAPAEPVNTDKTTLPSTGEATGLVALAGQLIAASGALGGATALRRRKRK